MESIGEMDPAGIAVTGGWVLLKRAKSAEKVGRFYVPEEHRKASNGGVLVKVGTDLAEDAKGVRVGDTVWTHSHAFVEARFVWLGELYEVVKSEDLVAVDQVAA